MIASDYNVNSISETNNSVNQQSNNVISSVKDSSTNYNVNSDISVNTENSNKNFSIMDNNQISGSQDSQNLSQSNPNKNNEISSYTIDLNNNQISSYSNDNLSNCSFIVSNFTTERLSGENFTATLVDSNGNPIKGYEIVFTLVNALNETKDYWRTTNTEGVAKLPLFLEYPAEYKIYASFYGNNVYNPTKSSIANVTILGDRIQTVISGSGNKTNQGAYFNITLTDVNGNPLANQNITVNLSKGNISKLYYYLTDENGVVHMPINLVGGEWNLSYSYKGNNTYGASSNSTKLTVISSDAVATELNGTDATFTQNVSGNYTVTLTDIKGNPLANQTILMNLSAGNNYKIYTVITNENGVANLPINLIAGTFNIAYSFEGSSDYLPSNGSSQITIVEATTTNTNAVWLFGRDMYNINLNTLATNGYGNIFLNYYAFTLYSESAVTSWIAQCNALGLKVHIWMQCFYDSGWISPVDGNGNINQDLFTAKVQEALKYANIAGVSGIHLDYIRFPGTAYKYDGASNAVTEFVKQVSEAVKSVNSNIILSGSVMPETTSNIKYYGQDVSQLGKYLDVIVPMIYKGNYHAGTAWITSTTKWFVANSAGAQIWAGLQAYNSDDDLTVLSSSQLYADYSAALAGGANGVAFFRYGLMNFPDLNE